MKQVVAYYRVSTNRQGESGLGLEAQKQAVMDFLRGKDWQVIAEFIEVESGKKSDRPELLKALEECRRRKAVLVIAKLDRLARNVHFISGLLESGAEFLAADNPHATKLLIHLLSAFAEHEREQISKRTRDALQAAKARGVHLGANGKRLAEQHKTTARLRDQQFYPVIAGLMRELRSYTATANRLNELAITTPSGGRWYAAQVRNVCLRAL